MNENSENKKDEEVNLLDLFVVLLRYRKLVAGIVVCSIALAVAGYFIVPALQYKYAMENRQAEGKLTISIKQDIRLILNVNPERFVNRADVVYASLKTAGMKLFEYEGQDASLVDAADYTKALTLIDSSFIKNTKLSGRIKNEEKRIFRIVTFVANEIPAATRDNFTIEVYFKDKDPEFVKNFLVAINDKANIVAGNYFRSTAENYLENINWLLNNSSGSEFMSQIQLSDFQQYTFITNFLAGDDTILNNLGDPVITDTEILLSTYQDSFILKGIIVVFAGIFIAVFIAFFFNMVRSVKSDEQAMHKIRDAIGKTEN
jgi:hypothetical protein